MAMSMALIARVVRPRRPTSFGWYMRSQSASTSNTFSPSAQGLRARAASYTARSWSASAPAQPMPTTPSVVTARTITVPDSV